ncbi:GGDEF domain-containing protein [Sphingomonas sp.]|uniref:GGDEF domain-containing protein n=2 Tax=unclassified Sphingomonas TaxID=196159 RepID=UPI00257B4F3E|nr:GGDEF domain-containing protein [Sphingomonas sp.]
MPIEKQATGPKILRFLDDHRLQHSPANYAFVHRVLIEQDAVLKAEVERIVDGGFRIGPDEVARLAGETPAEPAPEHHGASQLDRLTLRVLDIIGDAASATGDLNRDLVSAAASLVGAAESSIRSVVSAMIERTTLAEASLADATRQAQSLRAELNALRTDASRDRLTGLLNRAGVEERLATAIASPKGCAIALIDIDHFKRVNDGHGHAVGDRLLRTVATELADSCQPHTVARWDGGAFLILMEDMTARDANAIIDTARVRLASRRLKVRESDAPLGTITFSAGISSSRGRAVPALIASAEALLDRAKNGGRNRTEIEPPLVEILSPPSGRV